MFIDIFYENNYFENYIKKVLNLEKIEFDRFFYFLFLLIDNENI